MKIWAYCAKQFHESTRKVTGIEPLTCPPLSADTLSPISLTGRDLLYFDLHGAFGEGRWYGDDGNVALTAEQIRGVDLNECVVFAVNCYLGDENSPMLDALLEAGALYVIGGAGRNFAGERAIFGAGMLAQWFVRLMRFDIRPLRALALAKQRVALASLRDKIAKDDNRLAAAMDALEFRAFYKGRPNEVK